MAKYKVSFYKDTAAEWRFQIKHVNGNIIAESSEGYKNKADAKTAYDNLVTSIVDGNVSVDYAE